MKRKQAILSLPVMTLLLIALNLQAQDKTVQDLKKDASREIKKDDKDTTVKIWKTGGLFNFNFGQTSLSNWAAGGDDLSINVNGLLNLFAYYKKDRHSWDNTLDLALGVVKTTSLGTRKVDDRIDFVSKYGYQIAPKWYLSALFNFRTQFTDGFNYPSATEKVKTSTFMAPANILLSLGLDFRPNKDLSIFISPLTSRWVLVQDDSLSAVGAYGVDPGKRVRNEIGAFVSATYNKDVAKNLTYKGKLDLYSNYKMDPKNVDVYMTNLLALNVFKGLSVTIGLDMIYDDNVRIFGPDSDAARLQLREYVGIGYQKKF